MVFYYSRSLTNRRIYDEEFYYSKHTFLLLITIVVVLFKIYANPLLYYMFTATSWSEQMTLKYE